MLKRNMPVFLAIIVGIIFGNLLFSSYHSQTVMESMGNVYLLQYGAYIDEKLQKESAKALENNTYYLDQTDGVYYIYLGATTNYDNATRIKKIYDDKKIFLYIKNASFPNDLANEIKKYDDLILEGDDKKTLEYLKEIVKILKK